SYSRIITTWSGPPRGALREATQGEAGCGASRRGFIWPTNRGDTVERREALAPTSLGSRIPGGGPRWARPRCAGRSLRKGSAKGVSQTPKGPRKPLAPPGAPSPRSRDGKKGKGAPAPFKKSKPRGSGALARENSADRYPL